jgi:hypothetical protein
MNTPAAHPADRASLILGWIALALCLGGVAHFVWFDLHAPWGRGGELGGAALGVGATHSALIWASSSGLGVVRRAGCPVASVPLGDCAGGGRDERAFAARSADRNWNFILGARAWEWAFSAGGS